jgi:hypothetical protein
MRLGCDFGRSPRGQWKTGKKKFGCPLVLCSRHICQFWNLFADRCGCGGVGRTALSVRDVLWLDLRVPGSMLTQ